MKMIMTDRLYMTLAVNPVHIVKLGYAGVYHFFSSYFWS